VTKSFSVSVSAAGFNEYLDISYPAAPTTTIVEAYTTKSRRGFLRAEGRYSVGPVSHTFFGWSTTGTTRPTTPGTSIPLSPSALQSYVDNPSASTTNRSVYLQEELRFGKGAGPALEGGSTGIPRRERGFPPRWRSSRSSGRAGEAARRLRERIPCPTIFEKHGNTETRTWTRNGRIPTRRDRLPDAREQRRFGRISIRTSTTRSVTRAEQDSNVDAFSRGSRRSRRGGSTIGRDRTLVHLYGLLGQA